MASSDDLERKSVDLQLRLQLEAGQITGKGLQDIVDYIYSRSFLFKSYIEKRKDLTCVLITDICFKNGAIFLTFDIKDGEQLDNLYECIKDYDNELSRCISKFFFDNSLELIVGLRLNTKVKCIIQMPEDIYLGNRRKHQYKEEKRFAGPLLHGSDATATTNTTVNQPVSGVAAPHVETPKGTERSMHGPESNHQNEHGIDSIKKIDTMKHENSPPKGSEAAEDGNPNANQMQMRQVRFLLYFPTNESLKEMQIQIQSECGSLIGEMKLHGTDIYEYVASLPINKLSMSYHYVCCFKSGYWRSKIYNQKSKTFDLNHRSITRDNWILKILSKWGQKIEKDLLNIHLADLLFHCQESFSLSDGLSQIEQVCSKRVALKDAVDILQNLAVSLSSGTDMSKVLFVFTIANILEKPDLIKDCLIDSKMANDILVCLQKYTIKDIPEARRNNVRSTCYRLCMLRFGGSVSQLEYMNACYPFYEDAYLLQRFQTHVRSKGQITPDKLSMFDCALQLGIKLRDRACIGSDTAKECLGVLLRCLPFKMSFFVLTRLNNTEETSQECELETLLHSVKTIRIESNLNEIRIKRNLAELMDLWKIIYETESSHSLKPKFEETLILVLDSFSSSQEQDLKTILDEFISRFKYFHDCDSTKRNRLLLGILKSQSQAIRELFFTIMNIPKMQDELLLLKPDVEFKSFCQIYSRGNTSSITKRVQELQSFLSHLNFIWSRSYVKESESFNKVMVNIWQEELRRYELEELLDQMNIIIEMSKTNECLMNEYTDYIIVQLKRTQTKPEYLLRNLKRNEQYIIDTWLSAYIVCTLLETFGKEAEGLNVPEHFLTLIKHHKFWMLVFYSSGEFKYIIEKNDTYKRTVECINNIVIMFQEQDVNYSFVRDLKQHEHKMSLAKTLLQVRLKENEVDKYFSNAFQKFKEFEQKYLLVQEIMIVIKRNYRNVPDQFDEVLNHLEEVVEQLTHGSITINECESALLSQKEFEELPQICGYLRGAVNSSVFWNVSSEHVRHEYSEKIISTERDEPLLYLCRLFQEYIGSDEEENGDCMLFVMILKRKGSTIYADKWRKLLHDDDFRMEEVLQMFKSSQVSDEIHIAQQYLHIEIEKDVEDCLHRIFRIDTVKNTVDAMETVVDVFNLDMEGDENFSKAINSFRQLLNGTAEDFTFPGVKQALSTVFSLVQFLSDETINIIIALGKATSLVGFLRSIVDDDIKNLIDAVEDISEQQVQESTVSALIEVKQFLYPFLILNERKCEEFFSALEKQTSSSNTISKSLPSKVEDCIQNLHNLKSLYNGVANRGEQTKEMIKNITQKGIYNFLLDTSNASVTFNAAYKQNSEKESRSRSTLIDLRSRALLLMNTDRKSESEVRFTELTRFVENIDLCLNIAEILFSLFSSGHTDYLPIKKSVRPDDLGPTKEELSLTLNSWLEHLRLERENYYLLNFIQGHQIHILYSYLEDQKKITSTVQTILKFIHPDMQASNLYNAYKKIKHECENWNIEQMIHSIGFALHSTLDDINKPMFKRIATTCDKRSMNTTVQSGRVTVAQLEHGSLHTVKTVLSLYINTTQSLPEPSQIVFCTVETRWTEIELLIQRCIGAYDFYEEKVLFCIANVEMLSNEIQFTLVEALRHLQKEKKFYLAVVCRGSRNHPIIDELSDCVTSVNPATDRTVRDLFIEHCKNVTTVTSDYSGIGKSSYIVSKAHKRQKGVLTLHVSGSLRKSNLVEKVNMLGVKQFNVLHIDLGNVENPSELDTFLFELVVLRYVSAGNASVSLQTSDVYIEVANTINDSLRNALQTAVMFQRIDLEWNGIRDMIISYESNSPIQVVCQYLDKLEKGFLDKTDITFDSDINRPLPSSRCKWLLCKYLGGKLDGSFPILFTFINVLADQLKKMSQSSFFKMSRLIDMVGKKVKLNVKSKLVEAMIEVCRDFASRSVEACRKGQISTIDSEEALKNDLAVLAKRRVERMIRWEDSNHLMFVFHNQNIHTISALYRNLSNVPDEIKVLFESQMKKKMADFKNINQEKLQEMLQKVARINPLPLPSVYLTELAKEYALTADNLLKMILVILRVKANIPVVIMGETGCGKTSLIRYLATICEVDFDIMSIHAGVKESDIEWLVSKNNNLALSNQHEERWLFLDEINTSDSIGFIADIICHHRCLGQELAPNLVIMGACNPYRLRTSKAISNAGLEGKAKSDELSRLVYRVLPLPEMLVDYVWDFGCLNEKDEEIYIYRMVGDVFIGSESYHTLFTSLLSFSQSFVRRKEETSYAVSLRDIQRCKILTKWFLSILSKKKLPAHSISQSCPTEIKAMILSLAHCYQSRFSAKTLRKEYRCGIGAIFSMQDHRFKTEPEEYVRVVIKEEQYDILRRMKLPPGIATNTALQENVFVILVCIFNRIPIFVVGKPGCSKSLAMQLIKSNLRGKDSEDDFFKELPQLYCVSFQGSESSTSDGIIKVFAKAEKYQEANNVNDVLSVVILDEIGLAEVSRFNPLKVLHNLLEPDGQSQPNVAVVGISNWALDASKMNRAIHLSRTDMDEEELYETAISISESFLEARHTKTLFNKAGTDQQVMLIRDIKDELRGMARAYVQYIDQLRFKNFHGLRDYYSLIKFVALRYSEDNNRCSGEEKASIISEGIKRNFGGLPEEVRTLNDVFRQHIPLLKCEDRAVLELVTENITDHIARHLMLISTGESVLGIIEQKLKDIGCDRNEVIFGSQFEEDLTDDYNYRILSRIILCMEEGFVLILKDLESVYGSLYDMLNQNYTIIGKKKNCRIALGPYSNPICHVADTFRCIVLVNENLVSKADPPFLNRFEKQYLRFKDIIEDKHCSYIEHLERWISSLSSLTEGGLQKLDMFPINNEDLIASLVLKSVSESGSGQESEFDMKESVLKRCKDRLLWIIKPEIIVCQMMSKDGPNLTNINDTIRQYFSLPLHNGLEEFLKDQIGNSITEGSNEGLLSVVFTNSNVHTKVLLQSHQFQKQVEKLGAFKSEKQLTSRIKHFWDKTEYNILIVQCNAKEDEKHILLTKQIIERFRDKYTRQKEVDLKHVCLLIHLDRSHVSTHGISQLNFLSDWKLAMLDSLESPSTPLPTLCKMNLLEAIYAKRPLNTFIKDELYWAYSRIRYTYFGRDVSSIETAITKLEESPEILEFLERDILCFIEKHWSGIDDKYWQLHVARNITALTSSASYIDALEQFIIGKIKVPLAKLVFKIEDTGVLESLFEGNMARDDKVSDRTWHVWVSRVQNEKYFSIDNIPDENGPECYTCEMVDYRLRMPFSKYIYDNIEATKDDFLESVRNYRLQCLLEEDEELPLEVYDKVLQHQEQCLVNRIPDLMDFTYTDWEDDYLNDFCTIASQAVLTSVVRMEQGQNLKHILERLGMIKQVDPFVFIIHLHTSFWVNINAIRAQLILLDKCIRILPDNEVNVLSLISEESLDDTKEEEKYASPMNYEKNHLGDSSLSNNNEKQTKDTDLARNDYLNRSVNSADDVQNVEDMEYTINFSMSSEKQYEENKEPQQLILDQNVTEEMYDELQESVIEANDDSDHDVPFVSKSISPQTKSVKVYGGDDESHTFMTHAQFEEKTNRNSRYDRDMSFGDKLVTTLCQAMLPTQKSLQKHGGPQKWVDEVEPILSLAAQVSRTPEIVYSVRVCTEIAATVIVPYHLDQSYLEKLGTALSEGFPLDAEDIFICIEDILKAGLSSKLPNTLECNMHILCHRIFTSYFVRCFSSNPNTTAFKFIFRLVEESKIPVYCMVFYKVPLGIFLQAIDRDLLLAVLSTDDVHNLNFSQSESDESDDESLEMQFVQDLDRCLRCLVDNGRFNDPFIVLVTDILNDTLRSLFTQTAEGTDDIDEDVVNLFYTCHKNIKECTFGLRYIASIAYCKEFLCQATEIFEEADSERLSKLITAINVCLSDLPSIKPHDLTIFFMKNIYTSETFVQLQNYFGKFEDKCRFTTCLEFHQDTARTLLERSPMCLYVDEDVHKVNCSPLQSADIKVIKENIQMMVNKSTSSSNDMLQFLGFTTREFFLQQMESDLDDTRRTQAQLIFNEVLGSDINEEMRIFIKCIIGEQNFFAEEFLLTRSSTVGQWSKASILTTFYALQLTHNAFHCKKGFISFYARCMLCPESIEEDFIPGFSISGTKLDTSGIKRHRNHSVYLGICKCGYKILFEHDQGKYSCPYCFKDIKMEKHSPESDTTPEIAKGNELFSDSVQPPKHLNPVTGHILQLLVKGCFLGALALKYVTEDKMRPLIQSTKALSESIDMHWEELLHLLNTTHNELVTFIHALFLQADDTIFAATFKTMIAAHEFEERLDKIICNVTEAKFNHIRNVHRKMDIIHKKTQSIEQRLLEIDIQNEIVVESTVANMPNLYRVTANASKSNFCLELFTHKEDFPFLSEVINHEEVLRLPKHIMNLMQWHFATVANASYMLKRHDTSTMTAQDFIYFKQDSLRKDVMKARFELFKASWDDLITKMADHNVGQKMKRIHSESKLADCLIMDENSVLFEVLKTLIGIQNKFLERVLLVAHKCDALKFLKKGSTFTLPYVNITSLQLKNLINHEIDWCLLLEQESQCDLEYGSGKYVHYFFHSIEEAVAYEIVSGKTFIDLESLPEIVFIDELHRNYAFLTREIKTSVSQTVLTSEIRTGITNRKDEDPRMSTELLNHLGIVMTLVKKTGGDPETPLVDFVDEWKTILCRHFPRKLLPVPETCVKLCHIVALSDLLEQLSAESVKEGLGDEFREKIDGPIHDQLLIHLKDDTLSAITFKALKMFIYRCLASRVADPKQSLMTYLSDESFWPVDSFQHGKLVIGGKSLHLSDILPEGLKVRHVFECYDLLETEIERQRQGNLKMSGFATDFRAKAKATPPSKFAQKKKKYAGIRKF